MASSYLIDDDENSNEEEKLPLLVGKEEKRKWTYGRYRVWERQDRQESITCLTTSTKEEAKQN